MEQIKSLVSNLMKEVEEAGYTIEYYRRPLCIGWFDSYNKLICLDNALWGKMHDFVFLHEYMHYQQYLDNNYVPYDNESNEYDCDHRVICFLLRHKKIASAEEYAEIVYKYRGFMFNEIAELHRKRITLPSLPAEAYG